MNIKKMKNEIEDMLKKGLNLFLRANPDPTIKGLTQFCEERASNIAASYADRVVSEQEADAHHAYVEQLRAKVHGIVIRSAESYAAAREVESMLITARCMSYGDHTRQLDVMLNTTKEAMWVYEDEPAYVDGKPV